MLPKVPVSVLVAPLDWGLGHATRCIPIIKELIRQGARVLIATSGLQKNLLIKEFPDLEYLELPGYGIRYRRGILLKWALIAKIPVIFRRIESEQFWLKEAVNKHAIDVIISDNRYGLYHQDLLCVFITHQLALQSGKEGGRETGRWKLALKRKIQTGILKWNYKLISKFSCCWIPDYGGNLSIAGLLSHPGLPCPIPITYIGILSRFHLTEKKILKNSLLILISGPEPQRSDFEIMLLQQLKGTNRITTIARGLPTPNNNISFFKKEGVNIYNHLPDETLNNLLLESEYIICRSGYSTIMDLLKLKRNAIIIPTTGQTEQEYLASYLDKKGWMYAVDEKDFNIEKVIDDFNRTALTLPEIPGSVLNPVLHDLLKNAIDRKSAKL